MLIQTGTSQKFMTPKLVRKVVRTMNLVKVMAISLSIMCMVRRVYRVVLLLIQLTQIESSKVAKIL